MAALPPPAKLALLPPPGAGPDYMPPPAAAARPRRSRFALMACAFAVAATLGAAGGPFAGRALGLSPAAATTAPDLMTAEAPAPAGTEAVRAAELRSIMDGLRADIAAIRAAQAQAEVAASRQLDRLDARFAAAEKASATRAARLAAIEADLASRAAPMPVPGIDPATTAAIPPPEPGRMAAVPAPAAIEGWIVHHVRGGRALMESRRGFYEVAPGSFLPGAGVVQRIMRRDGRWAVVTDRGIIRSAERSRRRF